jgi:hypothetical protein
MHDPCACILSLVWDVSEQAYYRCFLSTDGKTKKKIWMSKPIGSMATINFNGGKKKRKERDEKEREEEDCAGKDQSTQKHGYCCHQHAKVAKTEEQEEEKKQRKLQKGKLDKFVDGPDHCIHCDEELCVFIQIELRLCENDKIYFYETDYDKDHVAYNSSRRKRPYQYTAFIL